jgi:hypothetical protein
MRNAEVTEQILSPIVKVFGRFRLASNLACAVFTHFTDTRFIGFTASSVVARSDLHPAFSAVVLEQALVPLFNLN